jgi:hypothetical protein
MFGFFRRKKKELSFAETIMAMSDDRFALFSKGMFEGEPPATHAMIIVAYVNLEVIVPALISISKDNGGKISIDDLMTELLERLTTKTDEITKRRRAWFSFAFLQIRLMKKAETSNICRQQCLENWILMAESGAYLKAILSNNIVWTDDEKQFFKRIKDESGGVEFVTNNIVPISYRVDDRFAVLGKKHSFHIKTHA